MSNFAADLKSGYIVWKTWRDTMLEQGRDVASERMEWRMLSPQDRELDAKITKAVIEAFVKALQEELEDAWYS